MEQDIIEGNKLIAEFMGAKLTTRNNELAYFVDKECEFKEYFRVSRYNRYHSDWNQLMSVYYKLVFELMWDEEINRDVYNGLVRSFNEINTVFGNPSYASKEDHMKSVWLAVIAFVKWYNTTITSK